MIFLQCNYNYRGICVSSCLGKLFCSILNQRLLEHIVSLNILHKSQIGFLPNTAQQTTVFTLRTLIDKYVHNHKEKIYVCFADFKKAFDSVWLDGLLNKSVLQINVGGCFYHVDNLIKSCISQLFLIKIAQKQTRQGCILSSLLFNLYINDLPFALENTWPFCFAKRCKIKFSIMCRRFNHFITIQNRTTKLPR